MAKMYGITGALRGKIGSAVFSVKNGTQVVRQYQPVVSNPKSDKQIDQRRKAILVGKISHAFKAELLTGLTGGSKSGRRSRFLKILLDAAVTADVIDRKAARITASNVILAEGVTNNFALSVNDGVSLTKNQVAVRWTDMQQVYQEGFTQQMRVIVLELVETDDFGTKASTRFVDINLSTGNANVPFVNFGEGEGVVMAWGIPIVGKKDANFNVVDNNATADFIQNHSQVFDLGQFVFADSMYLGSVDYTTGGGE